MCTGVNLWIPSGNSSSKEQPLDSMRRSVEGVIQKLVKANNELAKEGKAIEIEKE